MGKDKTPKSASKIPIGGIPLPGMVTRSRAAAAESQSQEAQELASTSTNSSSLSLRKFDGRNYTVWKAQAEAYMLVRDCYDAISKPAPEDEKAKTAWLEKNELARAIILLALDDNQAILVVHLRSAREIWERLEMAHRQSSSAGRISIQRLFYGANMKEGEPVLSYIARVQQIFTQLLESGVDVDEATLVGRIVAGLTQNWHTFMTNWANSPDTPQTIAELLPRLKAEEVLISREKRPMALLASKKPTQKKSNPKSRNQNSNSTDESGPRIKCGYCKKRNHHEADCRKKIADSKPKEEAGVSEAIVSEANSSSSSSNQWIIDSGCTDHMTTDAQSFINLQLFDEPKRVRMGDLGEIQSIGIGDIKIASRTSSGARTLILKDVLLVPDLRRKLFSLGSALNHGCKAIADQDSLVIYNSNDVPLVEGHKVNNLFEASIKEIISAAYNVEGSETSNSEDDLELWHERFGHVSKAVISKLNKLGAVTGLEKCKFVSGKLSDRRVVSCEACCLSKHAKSPIPLSSRERAKTVGQSLHMDICGPIGTDSFSGGRYIVLFKDEYSNYRFTYVVKSREEAFNCIRMTVSRIKSETGQKVLTFVSDCGSEMTSNRSKAFFSEQGIIHQTSAPFFPQQNGFIERENRTLLEAVRAMLYHRRLPERFWGEACMTAAYLLNRVTNKNTKTKTPFELYFNRKPRVSHLRIFGSIAYVKAQHKKRSGYQRKLEPRSEKYILVGYDRDFTYRLYDPANNKIVLSRDVIFDETKLPEVSVPDVAYDALEEYLPPHPYSNDPDDPDSSDELSELSDPEACTALFSLSLDEPSSYREATTSREKAEWLRAMDSEYNSLIKNDTWTLSEVPDGKKVIQCRWVYRIKGGEPPRFKARLVAKGFTQKAGVDYDEIFSPVVRLDSVRLILSIVASKNMELAHFDVRTAFLYGKIDKEIYMSQPPGYIKTNGNSNSRLACKLNKSIYGLKQASKVWNDTFTNFLLQYNLHHINCDSCVFTNRNSDDLLILAIYVDDGLVATSSKKKLLDLLSFLKTRFEISVTEATCYVGLQITRDREKKLLHIKQSDFARKMIERFNLQEAKTATIPMSSAIKFVKTGVAHGEISPTVDVPYRQAIGCLIYLMNGSRPDLACAVGILSRFCSCYTRAHWDAVKMIIRYVKSTINFGILFSGSENELVGFSDSDFAGCLDTRRSISGYTILRCNGPIIWRSAKQATIAESTTEAELIAANLASREIVWLRNFISELIEKEREPTKLNVDNQSAIKLIKNNQVHSKIKHIDIKMCAVRERESSGQVAVRYVPTQDNTADIFTKPLDAKRFSYLRAMMSIIAMVILLASPANATRFSFESDFFSENPSIKLTLRIVNPCSAVTRALQDIRGHPELTPAFKRDLAWTNMINDLCHEVYSQRIVKAIQNLHDCQPHREKRDIITAARAAISIVTFIIGITNTIRGLSQESSSNSYSLMPSMNEQLNQSTYLTLTDRSAISNEIEQGINAVSPSAANHRYFVTEEMTHQPQVVWSAYKVINELYAGAANINAVAQQCSRRQVATQELAEMLERPELALTSPEETFLENIEVNKNQDVITLTYKVEKTFNIRIETILLSILVIVFLFALFFIIRAYLRMVKALKLSMHNVQDPEVSLPSKTVVKTKTSYALAPL